MRSRKQSGTVCATARAPHLAISVLSGRAKCALPRFHWLRGKIVVNRSVSPPRVCQSALTRTFRCHSLLACSQNLSDELYPSFWFSTHSLLRSQRPSRAPRREKRSCRRAWRARPRRCPRWPAVTDRSRDRVARRPARYRRRRRLGLSANFQVGANHDVIIG